MNLEEFCDRFQVLQNQGRSAPPLGEASRQLLRNLLQDPSWFGEFLLKYIADPAFLSDPSASVFDNEIKLYRSPDKSFLLLAYIWDSPDPGPIHDHGAWGIIGGLIGSLREIKYQRTDDKQVEGYAELNQISDTLIKPEDVRMILPLDKGIHQTGAADDQLTVTFHIYGRSIRRGYIHCFYPVEKKVTQVRKGLQFRKVLALQALAALGEAVGKRFLTQDLIKSLPEDLVKEFRGMEELSKGRATESRM
jgi:predicted metal-dependent enzyme (double-stranded beta helix superfamily)